MNVQERVAKYIQEHGIMQKFIVEKTGFNSVKVSNLLNLRTKMTADEFEMFCIALNKSPNDFINIED